MTRALNCRWCFAAWRPYEVRSLYSSAVYGGRHCSLYRPDSKACLCARHWLALYRVGLWLITMNVRLAERLASFFWPIIRPSPLLPGPSGTPWPGSAGTGTPLPISNPLESAGPTWSSINDGNPLSPHGFRVRGIPIPGQPGRYSVVLVRVSPAGIPLPRNSSPAILRSSRPVGTLWWSYVVKIALWKARSPHEYL